MSEQPRPPLEESPEVAAAIDDDVAVDAFITGGGADDDTPRFQPPVDVVHDEPEHDPADGPHAEPVYRTGADQPWDPEDLAVAEGRDPTPGNVERARAELDRDGPAAVERTVP